MAQNIDLFGTTRVIPETGETGWGTEATNAFLDLIRGTGATDGIVWLLSGNKAVLRALSTNNLSLAASATITPATLLHFVSGSGAITLNATTSVNNGTADGQFIFIVGDSTITTNTVSITDASNVRLNGNITLGANHVLLLRWNTALSDWVEIFRSH